MWGMLLNYTFAILILKTSAGIAVFQWLADKVTAFLGFTDQGAAFVFGRDTYLNHRFAFAVSDKSSFLCILVWFLLQYSKMEQCW